MATIFSANPAAQAEPLSDGRRRYEIQRDAVPMQREAKTYSVVMDQEAIRRQYSVPTSPKKLEEWVQEHTGFIRKDQLQNELANRPIPLSPGSTNAPSAFQPQGSLRGTVLEFPNPQDPLKPLYFDLKGNGTQVPQPVRNGLLSLPAASKEFMLEKVIKHILISGGFEMDTVDHFGVVGSSFDIVRPDGTTVTAAKLWRAAEERGPLDRKLGNYFLDSETVIALEGLLRLNGITTSVGTLDPKKFSGSGKFINIQGTVGQKLFDFGHYEILSEFEANRPVLTLLPGKDGVDPIEIWKSADPEQIRKPVTSLKWDMASSSAKSSGEPVADFFEQLPANLGPTKDYALAARQTREWLSRQIENQKDKITANPLIELLAKGEISDPAQILAVERAYTGLPVKEATLSRWVELAGSNRSSASLKRSAFRVVAGQAFRRNSPTSQANLRALTAKMLSSVSKEELAKDLVAVALPHRALEGPWRQYGRIEEVASQLEGSDSDLKSRIEEAIFDFALTRLGKGDASLQSNEKNLLQRTLRQALLAIKEGGEFTAPLQRALAKTLKPGGSAKLFDMLLIDLSGMNRSFVLEPEYRQALSERARSAGVSEETARECRSVLNAAKARSTKRSRFDGEESSSTHCPHSAILKKVPR